MAARSAHPAAPPDAATLAALEWPRLLEALQARLATPYGLARLEALRPLAKRGAVRHALVLIDELKALRAEGHALVLEGAQPLGELLDRAARQGRLEAGELAAVLNTQRAALQAAAVLRSLPGAGALEALAASLHPLADLEKRLGGALTATGTLNEGAFPELARLRTELHGQREAIHRKLEALLRSPRLEGVFQDDLYTLRGRRYVLPVKADFKGQLPGIVHDVSASGQTLFVEPRSLVDDTNALAMAEKALELEMERILSELSALVGQSAGALRENLAWIGQADLLQAQAMLSEGYQGSAPEVTERPLLDLRGAAHPLMLLEQAAPGGVVRNDIALGEPDRCMVISGANTGGKTVLLKTVGLCALLVRYGMHVPAGPGSRCGLFADIRADIGDQQSLATSLSTFSAQIETLAGWLPGLGAASLVLLDEMLTGTEPAQGAALGAAVLEYLLEQEAVTLVTTHFGELKELAARHPGIANASMAFDPERLRPTYRLRVGLPGASYALHIARRHGLPEPVVARAEDALAGRPAALDDLLLNYQQAQSALDKAEAALRRREQRMEGQAQRLGKEQTQLASREREVRRREQGEIGRELRQARRRIAGVIKSLQQANSLPLAGKASDRLAGLERELAAQAPPRPKQPAGLPPPVLEAGAPVWLVNLERRAVVENVLDGGERARVRLGGLTMEVEAGALAGVAPGQSRKGRKASAPRNGGREEPGAAITAGGAEAPQAGRPREISLALATGENTLDLRGMRLDEAIERSEQFFDLCTMKHISPVLVIHGHGTGRLKLGLRERFADSPYVTAFRPGEPGEGRDGVTVVALNL